MRALLLLCAEPSRLGTKAYPSGDHFSSRWLFRLRCFSRSFSLRLCLGPSAVDFLFLSLLFLGLPLDVLVLLDVFGGELNAGGLPAEHILHRLGEQNVRRGGGYEKIKTKNCQLLVHSAVLLAVLLYTRYPRQGCFWSTHACTLLTDTNTNKVRTYTRVFAFTDT